MSNKKTSVYQVLVYAAYSFYMLFGLVWFSIVLFGSSKSVNIQALLPVIIFGLQAYFRKKMLNMLLGIITLFISIFMLLEVVDTFALQTKTLSFYILLLLSLISIILSGILIFSYKKFNE